MEKRSTNAIDAQYITIPSDWLETIRFNIQGERQLELASYAEIIEKRRQFDNSPGEPRLYAMAAGNFEVWPTPDGTYTGEIIYYARPSALSGSVASNWMLDYAPELYLYGALMHAAPYLVEDERMQTWSTLYGRALQSVMDENDSARWGGTGLRLRRRGM